MVVLRKLLENIDYECVQGSLDIEVSDIYFDSREVLPNGIFICLRGQRTDGNDYVQEAIENGANVIITEEKRQISDAKSVCVVPDARKALAYISALFFGNPSKEIRLIGITGTKGKTTTAYMVKAVLEENGHKCGLMGTIEVQTGANVYASKNTTLESYCIHKYLREMVNAGCEFCIMEVSSQGLMMKRVLGISFAVGVFTNLSEDHVGDGEHASFEEYCYWKSMLFRKCAVGIFNADDKNVMCMRRQETGRQMTFGFLEGADLCANDQKASWYHNRPVVSCEALGRDGRKMHVQLDMPGQYNLYNALAAVQIGMLYFVPVNQIQKALEGCRIKGRMEYIHVEEDYTVLIDYAHNSVSLRNLLLTLREYKPIRLVCLFGCGGNRAKSRRYEMGEIAGKLADYTIVTSDNPRFERPEEIIEDIRRGLGKTGGSYIEIADRRKAIRYAIANHKKGDLIVLAGKGHEMYQEIDGCFYSMDERQILTEVLEERK